MLPLPKLDASASAKPPRMATSTNTMIPVPTLDLETRRKKVSIGFREQMEEERRFRGQGGAHQAAPLVALERVGKMALKKLVAGNWKMHGLSSDLDEVRAIAAAARDYPNVDVALCVPAILIERAARSVPGFAIGGQDVHHAEKGAHTGCTSAAMLLDAGASLTIVGHSERRQDQREIDEEVKSKAEAALAVGLNVILCVGESLEAREQGDAIATVVGQLEGSLPASLRGEAELAIA